MAVLLPPIPYGSPPGSSFWNDWYEKLRTLINTGAVTVTWANINFIASNITDIVNRAHNNLQSIQGGAAGEYYHLTSAQHAALAAGPHNNMTSIQGGVAAERYHMTAAQHTLATNYTHNTLNSLQGGVATERYHLTIAQHTDLTGGTTTTLHTHARTATASLDFPSIASLATAELAVTVTGAVVGKPVITGPPAAIAAGLMWAGYVSAADTVKIRLYNSTGAAIDPVVADWTVSVSL